MKETYEPLEALQHTYIDARAVTDFYTDTVNTINSLVDCYDKMPYKTGEDKKRQRRVKGQIEDYWQFIDACTVIARRGGIELPEKPRLKQQGEHQARLWKNRKQPEEGEEVFTI